MPLILLALILRMVDLGGPEFWFDEALTANVSGLGWQGIMAHLSSAPFEHPPLYFLSLYPWQLLVGTSEFAFRFYSVFWGVLTIPLLYVLVRQLANRNVARLAALAAVCSPFLVAYSQEARMYSLLPCLAVVTLLVFRLALRRPHQPAWWLAYLVLLAGGVVTHYFFAWIWLTGAIFLGLEALRHRRVSRWAVAGHGLAPLVVTTWLLVAPGLRASLVRLWQGEMAFGLAYKMGKVMPALVLSEIEGASIAPVVYLLAAAGWLLALLGAWWSRNRVLTAPAWRLLVLLLVVPLAGSFLVPYSVVGRHLGYVLVSLCTFWALGLLALYRAGRGWFVAGTVTLLLFATYGLAHHYSAGQHRSFGQALAYVDDQGRAGDWIVLTQPGQQPLETYYNRTGRPVRYIPAAAGPLAPEEVEASLRPLLAGQQRLWLGPAGAWTADPEHLVERWLVANAFEAEQTWFPDSHSLALYYTGDELSPLEVGRPTWGGKIRLRSLEVASLEVAAGQALRLQFTWRAGLDIDERYQVSVLLVDGDGLVWAIRSSEPCGGWCPTDEWQRGAVQTDRHALLVPPGTPPGDYRLEIAWMPASGGPRLEAEHDGQLLQQVAVADVLVLAGSAEAGNALPAALPNPQAVRFGDAVTLRGYEPPAAELQPGESLRLETHWQVEAVPQADYGLLAELRDAAGQAIHRWQFGSVTGDYASSLWQPGQYLRGQHELALPSSLAPGSYRLHLALLSPAGPLAVSGTAAPPAQKQAQDLILAEVRVLDRPRRFDLPPAQQPLQARVGRQANLVGYDLDLRQAYPGGQIGVTLYWRAAGPMVMPFKVFTHLLYADGTVAAQHDTLPGGGCCPTNTWAAGEVIVDEHTLPLGAGVVPGTWRLVAGLYDEATTVRVPAYDTAGNRLPNDAVQVTRVPIAATVDGHEPVPTPQFEAGYIFLPLVSRGQTR